MAITIELPHVGESVVEGTIGKWLKQPGESIARFEPLVEVVTDKVTMEVPSPVSGSLLRVLAEEGETLPMGTPIAEIETTEQVETPTAPPSPAQPVAAPQPASAPPAASGGTTGYLLRDVAPVGPTGGGAGAPEALEAQQQPAASPLRDVARLSPAVRRLAREHGVDLSQVTGTGMGGRITRDDLLRYIESGLEPGPQAATAPAPPAAPSIPAPTVQYLPSAPAPDDPVADEEYVPLTPVRRMIAEAMVKSVTQIPHAWSTVEVDVSNLVALRAKVRAAFEEREGVDLTYLPFIIKAVVESLKEHRTLNASWGGDKIILKRRINLGIAVAAPAGLIVPVIHDADRLSIAGLAAAARDLTIRGRQNKLTLEDVQDGTFTLNNTGALGSIVSYPIINHPQAAILTTEAVQKRTVVRDDAIAIRSMMNLCLSFDHRINDGSESSAFLQAVKSRLEAISLDTSIY